MFPHFNVLHCMSCCREAVVVNVNVFSVVKSILHHTPN
jgi:hypothetical protein